MMKMQRLILASMLAASTAVVALPSVARVDIDVAIAPPAPLVETIPPAQPGYVWAPGYWGWNGHKHVWNQGRYIRERRGEHWVAHNWEHRGDRWYFRDGHWERNHG
jgi:hypothetical protein